MIVLPYTPVKRPLNWKTTGTHGCCSTSESTKWHANETDEAHFANEQYSSADINDVDDVNDIDDIDDINDINDMNDINDINDAHD